MLQKVGGLITNFSQMFLKDVEYIFILRVLILHTKKIKHMVKTIVYSLKFILTDVMLAINLYVTILANSVTLLR